jgi:hypothetical protein
MKQRNTKHEKRLKKLVLTCLLLAIVLTVGTYAWFIGMQTVSVEAFEVKIATVEDLALSLDGTSWSTDLTITEDILKGNDYAKTTYSWTGLKPVSTIGEISATTNKLVMYDKGSLTATDGGYRLMSALVQNKVSATDEDGNTISGEEDGYVAFDIFIKNMSGDEYYDTITTPSNEEAIYLSTDSKVTAGSTGNTVAGVENSARIAFAQIGRVKSDAKANAIQAISCATGVTGMTPICTDRLATIYEPNDTKHVTSAITWFTRTCKKRSADGSYTLDACAAIADGTAYKTYAVSGVIDHAALVDVYDGMNGYTGTVDDEAAANKLVAIDTFTDTEKVKVGTARDPFFYLAPNSITKVRVYVYLEGQDVDNYDFASLGYSIKAQFGFTKERFEGSEMGVDVENAQKENAEANQPAGE